MMSTVVDREFCASWPSASNLVPQSVVETYFGCPVVVGVNVHGNDEHKENDGNRDPKAPAPNGSPVFRVFHLFTLSQMSGMIPAWATLGAAAVGLVLNAAAIFMVAGIVLGGTIEHDAAGVSAVLAGFGGTADSEECSSNGDQASHGVQYSLRFANLQTLKVKP